MNGLHPDLLPKASEIEAFHHKHLIISDFYPFKQSVPYISSALPLAAT